MYSQYKGKKVYLLLTDNTYLYGRLENYRGKLYQVTGVESIVTFFAKDEALTFLAQEREKIMRMNLKEALKELIKVHKIESRIKTINAISDNGLFTLK